MIGITFIACGCLNLMSTEVHGCLSKVYVVGTEIKLQRIEFKNTVRALTTNLKKHYTTENMNSFFSICSTFRCGNLPDCGFPGLFMFWVCFVLEMCFVFNHQGTISSAVTLFVNASHSFHTFTVINEDMTLLIFDLILYTEDCFEL